jgi:GNAT superfamily N-acetyltransferase
MNGPESKTKGAPFRIRQAGQADLAQLASVAAGNGASKAHDYFEICLREQLDGKRVVHIVWADETPAGYGMLNFNPRYALYRRLGIPEIQDLNVLPVFRRQGMAGALIDGFENLARARNHEDIGISVGLYADYGAAQRLYIKKGYVPDGYGVTYDRAPVSAGEIRPIDDDLCLMLVKALS